MERKRCRKPSGPQMAALLKFMEEHTHIANGMRASALTSDKDELEEQWRELTITLNSMGGAVKSIDKWKQTWRDWKWKTKKRGLNQQQQFDACDTSMGPISDYNISGDASTDDYVPPKKKALFDEEIVKIEREKLELDREYKAQKIEALSRIASALEKIAVKKDKT